MKDNPKIYMDYAASTPVDDRVLEAMKPYFSDKFGNPGSLHGFGQEAIKAVDESRETIADALGADFREIVFTGSATEANNLAVVGALERYMDKKELVGKPKIIISSIEHESVIDTVHELEPHGVDVVEIGVDEKGLVNLDQIEEELDRDTVMVSVMYANNEVGTVEPIHEISEIVSDFRDSNGGLYPLLHTDAVQAFQYLECDVDDLGVDLMTISAHKIYGPKGIGALFVRKPDELGPKEYMVDPVVVGGGQEHGLRSGTENTPSIVGFGKAVEIALKKRDEERERMAEVGSYFWEKLQENISGVKLNGISIGERSGDDLLGLPNIYNIYFPGKSNDDFLIKLDMEGVAVSTGAACSARSVEESYVLKSLELPEERVNSSLRFSFGRQTDKKQVDEIIERIENINK